MTDMPDFMGAMNWIVLAALLLTVVFLAAWFFSRNLRRWIERPKYRFLADIESYDRGQAAGRPPHE